MFVLRRGHLNGFGCRFPSICRHGLVKDQPSYLLGQLHGPATTFLTSSRILSPVLQLPLRTFLNWLKHCINYPRDCLKGNSLTQDSCPTPLTHHHLDTHTKPHTQECNDGTKADGARRHELGATSPPQPSIEYPNASTPTCSTISSSPTSRHRNAGATPRMVPSPKIDGIQHIISVASAKGGVGKSTVAVNLALALLQCQLRIGLLDADIYGPSIPIMMNLEHLKPQVNEQHFLIPLNNYGLKCMSMGFLVPHDTAAIWRGPMVISALEQMLRRVEWGELDILVVDLPPGTGDAQLTLCQRTPLSGAVVVSTPQKIALADVHRGINMFSKVNVPILGVIENMSHFQCDCGKTHNIFGHQGAEHMATKMGIEFLGALPMEPLVRELSDQGSPIVVARPDSRTAQQYLEIARRIVEKIQSANSSLASKGPTITFE